MEDKEIVVKDMLHYEKNAGSSLVSGLQELTR